MLSFYINLRLALQGKYAYLLYITFQFVSLECDRLYDNGEKLLMVNLTQILLSNYG